MINPSAPGWIDKFLAGQLSVDAVAPHTESQWYARIRKTGFIYGHVVAFDTQRAVTTKGRTAEEISKLALISTLLNLYRFHKNEVNASSFVATVVSFYKAMSPEGFSLLDKVLPGSTPAAELEKIMSERVKTNDNAISRNFSHILTNALLFEDVLAFQQFLCTGSIPENYLKRLEDAIISIVSLALKTKTEKSNYDDLLIKLFESSVRYTKFSEVDAQHIQELGLDYFGRESEKYYLIDMACLARCSDGVIEASETDFLCELAKVLQVADLFVQESIRDTDAFLLRYKHQIPYFNYSNPVKHFYDHTTQYVMTLITRNRKRLVKELSNNGELMVLLTHSTHRSLDAREKKKVRKQLLEICKTIPAMTIFLLPGGSLLLPILVKFIPKMLPSAFNENLGE